MKIPSRYSVILSAMAVVVVHGFTVTTNTRSAVFFGRISRTQFFNGVEQKEEDSGLNSEETTRGEVMTGGLDGNRQDPISITEEDEDPNESAGVVKEDIVDEEDSEVTTKKEKEESDGGEDSQKPGSDEEINAEDESDKEGADDGELAEGATASNEHEGIGGGEESEGADDEEVSNESSLSDEKEDTGDEDSEGTDDGELVEVATSDEKEDIGDGKDSEAIVSNEEENENDGEKKEVTEDGEDLEAIKTQEDRDNGEGSKAIVSKEEGDSTDGDDLEITESDEDIDDGKSSDATYSEAEATEKDETVDVEVVVDEKADGDSKEQTAALTPDVDFASPTFSISTSSVADGSDDAGIKFEIVANVAASIAKEVAVDLLSFIRFGAANLLTSSLPDNQRQELLQRMGAQMLPPAQTTNTYGGEKGGAAETSEPEEKRASIQEEIALARAEEAQKNEKRWEREKEDIIRQMEEAANARVEDELKIQQMRLQQEQEELWKQKEAELEEEKQRFLLLEEEREKGEALANELSGDDKTVESSDSFAAKTEQEEEQNKQLEELMEKRTKQKLALESIEEELRFSVANEAEERERLNTLLEKRKEQQSELNVVEENLRVQVAEIEAEKAQFTQLLSELDALKEKEQKMQKEIQRKREAPDEEDSAAADLESDEASSDESEEDPEHPILGPVVADLGYKRVHLMSAGRLGNIPVWNRNRIYRNNRAKAMAAEKIKSMALGFPGAICLHESSNGKLSIVDGQHRVGMMAALKTTINKRVEKGEDLGDLSDVDKVFERILVEVYPEQESTNGSVDAFAEKVFLEINKAEPVKLIDMPGVASVADRKIITEAVETLNENFPNMFSPSQRCRIPNVNVDNLRSAVFGANILKKHKIGTSKKLVEWLIEKNAELGEEYENSREKQKLVSGKQWSKASASNFYLGLESSWLYK